jgi:hypothetical protein
MHAIPDPGPTDPASPPLSRRSLLRGGTALGLVALTAAGPGSASASAEQQTPGGHLILNYQPSQPTGWPATPGRSMSTTIGGHTPSQDFTFHGKPHRVSVLQSGDSWDPVYGDVPGDATLDFKKTLDAVLGAYYSFRYVGFRGQNELNVQSYGVFYTEPTEAVPETRFGGGLYVVYEPDLSQGEPHVHDSMRWIQVVTVQGEPALPPMVDNYGRPNPYYVSGGLTSIHGKEVFNFHDISQLGAQVAPAATQSLNVQFIGETFLARDTGVKDAAGKAIVDIFGGMKWGWRAYELQP